MKYAIVLLALVFSIANASPASESDMKVDDAERIFLLCDTASNHGVMDIDEAAVCSIAYEVLLKKKFHGDFQAFLTWWHLHKKD